jgi:hypothetical protein
MTPEEQTAFDIRNDPQLWFEVFGTILNRAGELIRPLANSFQARVFGVYRWCRDNQKPCRIIILKPRRKGSSTVSLALCYTHLRNHMGYGAVLGDDLGTTAKLMETWNRYVEHDKFKHWGNEPSLSKRAFTHGSKVYEETANDPRAGMGGDIHFLLASEAAHYRSKGKTSGEYVMQSVMNSVPNLSNSCVIIESTPNGTQGVFYNTWQSAVSFEEFRRGQEGNGYIRVFAPWFEFDDSRAPLHPGEERAILDDLDSESRYNGEIALVERHSVTADKLKWRRQIIDSPACGGDPRKFQQEFPSDAVSCFLQSGSGRFDAEGLDILGDQIALRPDPKYGILEQPDGAAAPVFIQTARHEAWMRVWEFPKEGRRYIGADDFMTGEQAAGSRRESDCHATLIARAAYIDDSQDAHKAAIVAAFLPDDRQKDLDIVAERIALLSKFYGGCLMAPEVNNLHGIIELLRRHGANLWMRKKQGTGKTVLVPGFQTNVSTKRQIIGELATLIREQELEIPCPRILAELRNFIVHSDGTEAAAEGAHDDWVMALAILAHVLPAARLMESEETKLAREARRSAYYRPTRNLVAECR